MLIKDNSINYEERKYIFNLIEKKNNNGELVKNNAGKNRYFLKIKDDEIISNIENKIKKLYHLYDFELDNFGYGTFISLQTNKAFVHEHTDIYSGFKHYRVNILISKPMAGGMPIIDGKEYNIEECSSWGFEPDINIHSSTPVSGTIHRMTLSIGFIRKMSSFTISARGKNNHIKDFILNFKNYNIDSFFGFTGYTPMYGGRGYNMVDLSEQDLEWMYGNNIGYRIPLTNIYADEKDYEASRNFLEKHHRKGNSVILANTNLVQKFRDEFPLYELESSVIINPKTIQQVEDLQSIFDTVVLHGQWNTSDKLLDIKDKNTIRLFAQMGCALNCPNKTCYKYFSEINSMRNVTNAYCSQSFIERENLGFVEFDIKELESKGFSKFKVLRNRGTTGY